MQCEAALTELHRTNLSRVIQDNKLSTQLVDFYIELDTLQRALATEHAMHGEIFTSG